MAIKLYTFTNPVPLTDRRSFNADATLLFKHNSPEEIPPNHLRVLRFNGYPSAKKVELVTSVRDVSGVSKTVAELRVAREIPSVGNPEQRARQIEQEQPAIKTIDGSSPLAAVYIGKSDSPEGTLFYIVRFVGEERSSNNGPLTPIEMQWVDATE